MNFYSFGHFLNFTPKIFVAQDTSRQLTVSSKKNEMCVYVYKTPIQGVFHEAPRSFAHTEGISYIHTYIHSHFGLISYRHAPLLSP